MNGPHWIKQWIADLAMLNDQFRNDDGSVDFDALGREEYMFRMALITRNFSKSERALVVFEKAQASYETNVERGKKGGRPRKSITADATTSEDVEFKSDSGDAGNLESATSANNSGARESQRRAGGSSVRGMAKVAQPPVRSGRKFRNKEEFIQWAIDDGLDPVDANECWEATEERGGKDADGNTVKNMKAFARQWCKTRAEKRRTA